jgi:exodeoxyribonuclease-3
MKIATWNVNSLRVRLQHVCDWLSAERPDVLALQETKTKNEDFPAAAFEALGYQSTFSGQPTYNGVALITRTQTQNVVTDLAGFEDPQRRVLGATVDGTRIFNLYVPNGQTVDSDKYHYKLRWLNALHAQLVTELAGNDRCVILGDFNIAPEDRDVHDPAAWEGQVLCSEPERAALARLRDLGFTDVFRSFEQADRSFSWWDYRGAGFRRNMGLRIDLILATSPLSERCSGSSIDVEPRRWERPSDHTPVIAEFDDK